MPEDLELCFRRLHGSNILGIVTADEHHITSANGEFLRMIGRTRADLEAGRINWQKLTPPEFAALDAQNVRRLKQQGWFPPFEKEYYRKDGGRVPVLLEGSLLTRRPFRCVCFVQDLTARKQAAAALRDSEQRYRLLAENAADLVSLHDARGKCLYRSPSFYRATGWTAEELDPATAKQRVHPKDWPAAKAAWDACLRGEPRVLENRYRCKNGGWLWLETRWQPVLGPDGRVEHFIITSHDITARKQAAEALRVSEWKYRRLHETMTDAFVSVSLTGEILEFNAAYREMLGYSEAELRRLKYQDLTPQKWHAMEAAIVKKQILPRGHSEVYEKEYRRQDGTVFPVELRAFLIKDDAGQPAGIWGIVRDITERKRAEEKLRVSEERYRAIFEGSAEGILVADVKTKKFIHANRTICRWLGYSPEELKRLGLENIHPAQELDRVAVNFEALAKGEKGVALDIPCLRKDGTVFTADIAPALMTLDDHQVLVGFFTDVTERKRAEEAARTNANRLEVLVQTAPAAIVIHGADGKLLRCNALAERLLGISKRRASGKTLKDRAWHFLREDGTPMPVEEYPVALVLKRQAPLANYVCGIQHAGKKTVWVLVNAQPRFDGDGALADITVAFIDITARKQAQDELQRLNATLEQRVSERTAALQAREERFRGVVQDQTELICRFGADGKVRFVNEVFCRFFGKTASQLIGQRWHPHALAEDLPRIESELGKLTKKNPVVVIENRVYNGPGELRWMQFVNRGFFDRQGRLLETQAVGRDITERKQAEEVLRASEARFRSYFESVTTGICITSPTAEWLEVNQRLCAMLGYSEAELRKTTWAQLTYPADLAPDLKQYKRVLAGEIDGYALEKRFVCKNGEIIWASLSVSCVRRADGQVDYFVGLLFDITARKQAEAASRASEEKFQRLFGTVADAVLLFDAQTRRILEVNDAMLRMYGYSREEALRLTAVELSAQPEATSEALQRAAAGLLGPNLRALHRKRDGTVFPVQISASTFEFQDRRLVCLVVRDITRELELEKEILAISEREQQRFARDVHDDLCQHLTGIQFLASTLAADLKDLARPESAGARRIAGLTRQALQKARSLSHGLAPVELEHGGLAVALRRLCLQVQSVFRCQCQLHCDLKVALPPPATAIHLYRIVQEAVSNAVRHGRASRIQITLAARPQGWALKIADNGRGFGKPKKTGAAKPGMGLRVMQYRAGMIGGTLAVRPRPRAGTEVICTMTGGVVPPARRKVR